MAVTVDDIKETFAEFASTSEGRIGIFLAQAERRVNRVQWGEKADDGILWLTAHLLKIEQMVRTGGTAPSGAVSQKRVGDLAVSYAVPTRMSDSFLASTTYGQYYLDLKSGIWPTRVLNGTVGSCC